MKGYAIISSKVAAREFIKKKQYETYTGVIFDRQAEKIFKKHQISYKKGEDIECTEGDTNKKAVDWIKKFGEEKLTKKKQLKDIHVKDLCIWYLAELWLNSDSRLIYPTVSQIFYNCEQLKKLERKKLLIFKDKSLISELALHSKAKKKIIEINTQYNRKTKAKLILSKKYSRWTYRKVISFFQKTEKKELKKKQLLGFSPGWILQYEKGGWVKKEVYNLIKSECGKNYHMTVIDPPVGFNLGFSQFPKNKTRYVPIEKYLDRQGIIESYKNWEKVKKEWRKVKKAKAIDNYAVYKGIKFGKLIRESLDIFFEQYLLSLLIELEMYKRIMQKEDPDAVISFYDTSLLGRLIIYAAKKKHILTLGIPHGAGFYACGLVHPKDEIDEKNEIKKRKCPTSDYIFTGGKADQDLFENQCSFKKEWLLATGLPKYDCIHQIKNRFSREKKLRSLGLKNKKTILFTSQALPKPLKKKLLTIVAQALKETTYQVIVKLHPMEYEGSEIHENIFKKNNTSAKYIRKDNILELLSSVDLVISAYSTVVSEAAAMETPFIIVDIYNTDYKKILHSEKIKVVKSAAELKTETTELMENKAKRNEYKKHLLTIGENQFGTLDGNAIKRIAKEIKRLIKSR